MNAFSNSCVVTAIASFVLGTFVFLRGVHNPINRLWAFFCISVGLWSLGLGRMVGSQTLEQAIFWLQWVHYMGAIMIPIAFFHFVMAYLGMTKRQWLICGYGTAVILQVLNFTGLLASLDVLPPFNFYTVPKPTYVLFVMYFFTYVAYSHWLLFQKWQTARGQTRTQIQYMGCGTLIGFCGGSTAFLPVFHLPVFPYGVYGVFVYVLAVTYAILKHRLMNIALIIRKTLVYSSVVVVLAAAYLITVGIFARIFEGFTGYQTVFSSAIAAGLISFCFQPVRKRIQFFIDSKFFRQYVDREEKLYELSREVITHTTPEALAGALMRVLGDTFHPKSTALYLKGRYTTHFSRMASLGDPVFPDEMSSDNPLASYFADHSQPFLLDSSGHAGAPHSTRRSHEARHTEPQEGAG